VSLDLVDGVDQKALFVPVMKPEAADLVGSTLLLGLSVAFMIGVSLRLTGLMLAVFVFTSSLIENFIVFEMSNISDFWRDLTLVCAVMMSYSFLTAKAQRDASIVSRSVRPQRIALGEKARRSLQAEIRAALSVGRQAAANRPSAPDAENAPHAAEDETATPEEGGQGDNIFAKI